LVLSNLRDLGVIVVSPGVEVGGVEGRSDRGIGCLLVLTAVDPASEFLRQFVGSTLFLILEESLSFAEVLLTITRLLGSSGTD
jgi:hypothetical protein